MTVSYNKLWKILIDRKMSRAEQILEKQLKLLRIL